MASQATIGNTTISPAANGPLLSIEGDWVLGHYKQLIEIVNQLIPKIDVKTQVDLSKLGSFDTAGANLLYDLLGKAWANIKRRIKTLHARMISAL